MKKLILIVFIAGLAFNARCQMPFNNAGSYEQTGELHNDIFNYVKDNANRPDSERDVVQAMDEYLREMNSSINASDFIRSPEYQETVQQFRAAADKEQFLMYDAGFTSQGAGYYTRLMKSLSTVDYEAIYNSIVILEEEVNRDKSLSTYEKRVLLVACAIGRYSAYNGIVTSGVSSDQQKIWVADVLGAIEGGLSGATAAGVITIGTAVLPGWASGALIGAARASIMAWMANSTE